MSGAQIRAAFDFLLDRGYSVLESDGIAGSVVYRSSLLWIAVDWDRADPCLSFTFTGLPPNSVPWPVVDRILTGTPHPEYACHGLAEAPVDQLSTFVRANIDELEHRLEPPHCAALEAVIVQHQQAVVATENAIRNRRRFR